MIVAILLAAANLNAPLDGALAKISRLGELQCDYEVWANGARVAQCTFFRTPTGRLRFLVRSDVVAEHVISDGVRLVEYVERSGAYRSSSVPAGYALNPTFPTIDPELLPPVFSLARVVQMRSFAQSPAEGFDWQAGRETRPEDPFREDKLKLAKGGFPERWLVRQRAPAGPIVSFEYRFLAWRTAPPDPIRYRVEPPTGSHQVPANPEPLWFIPGDRWSTEMFRATGAPAQTKPQLLVFVQSDCEPSLRLEKDASWQNAAKTRGYVVRWVRMDAARQRTLEQAGIELPGTPLVTAFDANREIELSFFGFGTEYDREVKRMVEWFKR